jgi:hypothetical protein
VMLPFTLKGLFCTMLRFLILKMLNDRQ